MQIHLVMVTKRAHIDIDPDYEDVTEHQSKRQRFLEEDAKETTRRKIEIIVKRQVSLEIRNKEVEIDNVDRALHQARITMDRLRACIVANYFGSAGQQRFPQGNSQQAIHPTVKDVIGKRPKDYPPEIKKETSSSIVIKSEPLPVPTDTAGYKSVTGNAANTVVKMETGSSGLPSNVDQKVISHHDSRTARFKIKKRIIVGNVSKYIPVDRRDENDQSTHKWMVYVRGPKDEPKIDHFVKKVWFFLHPSYRPNDLVEVSSSPFHLTRRGWGEFPVRVQLHFKDQRNKRLDIIHQLKLDRTYTGLQTLGAETVVDIELEKEKFEEKVPTPSLLRPTFSGGDSTLIAKMSETVSVKQENNITIPEQISPKKIKVEDSVFKNHLQGKVVQNGTAAMFSDKENQLKIEFKQTTETQNASKNANKIVIDASNQSLQSVVSALISNPNSLVQSGNIMVLQNILSQNKAGTGAPGNSLIIGPASQGVTRTSSNIKAETSGSGSKVSTKQAADVVKSSAPSSAQGVVSTGATYTLIKSVSPEKGKTLVRSTSSAGNLIVSPGVTKSPSVAMVTQVSSTSTLEGSKLIGQTNTAMQSVATGLQGTLIPQQAANIAKQTVATSSVLPQKTVTMATNSVTTQMTVQSAATQIKQPMKQNQILYTKQQSVTMPTLQHTVTSAKSVAMTTNSSLQSATTSTASQTFYVRCKDNQGNIFLVPHHLLKQVSQAPTMTTAACSTSSVNLTKGNLMTSPDSKKNVVGKASSLTNSITSSTSSQQIQVAANSSSGPASLCIKIEPQSQVAQSNITTLLSSILPQQASAAVPQTLLTSNKQEALPTPTASMNVKAGSGPLLLIKTDQSATSSSLSSGVLKPSSSSEENTFSVVDGKLVQSIASSAPSQLQLHLQGQISQSGTKGQGQLKVTSQGLKNIQEDVKSKILKGIPQSSNSSIVKSEIKSENKIPSKSCQLASLLKGDISAAHRNAKMATPTSQSSPQCVKGTIPVLGASTSSQGQTSLLALTSNVNVKSPLLLVGQDERKQTVAKSLVSGKPVANWNTQGTRPISGQSILTNIANGKGSQTVSTTSVTQSNPTSILTSQPLTFAKGQVNPAVQSKTVLAKIGNQTLLLQLPLTDASSAVAIDNTKGKPLSVSSCVTMAATKSESQNSVSIVTPASNKYLQSRHLGKNLSMQHLDDEKRILNWKKKKCYLTAPVPLKPIPPLKVTDYPDVVSLVRAAIKRHPIISSTADLFQHPYCARQREEWLGWNVGKRRASEWQRASSCRKYLRKQLNGELTFKREKLWTTKQIMCWCRLHAYSPHYLEKTLHPDSSDLMMEVMVGKKLSTATGVEAVLGRVDDIQIRQRHDSSGDEDVDIVSIEPPKVKVKEESPVKEEVKAPDIIPPSPEALFVQDISQKIGVKFSPSPVNDVLHASLSEDVVYTAMKSFIGEIITEAFAVKVNMGRYPDGLGVADIYKALSNLPQADFLTNKHLGIKDQDR